VLAQPDVGEGAADHYVVVARPDVAQVDRGAVGAVVGSAGVFAQVAIHVGIGDGSRERRVGVLQVDALTVGVRKPQRAVVQ
jgi:hypothetical protein